MADFTNPYVMQDVTTIIDAFTVPGRGQEIIENVSTLEGTGIFNVGGKYSYAVAQDKLSRYLDQASGAVETLYGYSTAARGESETLLGVEFKNTLLTMTQANSIEEASATLLADCVPCKDRVLSLLALNPLADLREALNAVYELQLSFVVDLWDFLLGDKSIQFYADLCSLLQFLNFMCVPDLVSMVLVLSKLVAKYTLQLKDIQISLQDILGKIFGGTLLPLLGVFEKYLQLIVAPIECVIGELDNTIQKLDVLEGWQAAMSEEQKDGWFEKIDTDAKTREIEAALGFITIRKFLKEAVDTIDADFDKLLKNIYDFLGIEDNANKEIFDVSLKIERVANIIGLLQAIILAVKQGAIVCGPHARGEEELENFVNTYVSPSAGIDITAKDGIMRVSPSVPNGLEAMKELLEVVGSIKALDAGQEMPATTAAIESIGNKTVPLSNCLYTVRDKELDKVKDFLSTFK